MKKIIFYITVFLFLTNCSSQIFQFKEKPNPPKELPTTPPQGPSPGIGIDENPLTVENFQKFLKIAVDETDVPEKYSVNFSWKVPSEPLLVEIRFKKFQNGDEEKVLVDDKKTNFSHSVPHSQTITYKFSIYKLKDFNSGGAIQSNDFTKSVEIPKDYVVRENNKILESNLLMRVNRFFLNDVSLTTNGYDLAVYANKFYSKSGLIIETFPDGTTSQRGPGSRGRDGGYIQLSMHEKYGDMIVTMRGENGAASLDLDGVGGDGGNAGRHVLEIGVGIYGGYGSYAGKGGFGRKRCGNDGVGIDYCFGRFNNPCPKKYPLDSLR